MSNATAISNELKKHIDFVVLELRTTSGARVIAAAVGIEEGVDDSDSLWWHGKAVIGMEPLQEGYIDNYELDDEGYLAELEEGRPHFGWGISISSHDSYLDLHEHFGAQWLEKSVMAGAATIGEAKTLLEKAQCNYEVARNMRRIARLEEISCALNDLASEAKELMAA